jgi:arsenate reductase (thioredoxin)
VKRRVLFLCTGNSCRSQMAEAIVNTRLSEHWEAFSAGTRPAGYVHPLAIQVLAEIGIAYHSTSKSVDVYQDSSFDLIVTVCDAAAEECPIWFGGGNRFHLGFPDPAKATGTPLDILTAFRQVRDSIEIQIPDLLLHI